MCTPPCQSPKQVTAQPVTFFEALVEGKFGPDTFPATDIEGAAGASAKNPASPTGRTQLPYCSPEVLVSAMEL